ncbi:MAG: energy-coupling factor transporter transmembrane protein EcfT [Coriobacteriia bacterium]|nr:energy-coupling factor transporter transmembrane protein EcfT [Coriobacteriia bacterium]
MSAPVPMGTYVIGNSFVHRLDARVKIVIGIAFAVALFILGEWWALGVVAFAAIGVFVLSGVSARLAVRGLRPALWLLAFTVVINALAPAGAGSAAPVPAFVGIGQPEALVRVGLITFYPSGLARGLFFATRVLILVFGASLVTLTTSSVAIADAFAYVLRPLAVLRFPVDDAAMMMSIALRFMPVTAEEAERIVTAQIARGAQFSSGSPFRRARAWLPVFVPLFVRLFRRADDLAVAMEARCYRGQGRTRLRQLRMRPTDWMVLVAGCAAAAFLAVYG